MTCICSATIPTMKAALKAIKEERGDQGEIQVELYGDWTLKKLKSGSILVLNKQYIISRAMLY